MAAFYICARRPEWWVGMVAAGGCEAAIVVYLWKTDTLRLRTILLAALGARIILFALPPVLSDDVFRYLWDGRLLAEGINPYLHVPSELRGQLRGLLDRMNSAEYYSIYPPVSQGIFWIGAELSRLVAILENGGQLIVSSDWPLQYYVTKGLFAILEGAGVLLLSRLVARRWVLLYALHPLVLLEAAGQGHTEAAMVFFLILTLWAVRRSHPHVASAALTCAGWVKLYPLVLFPFLWQRFRWRILPAACIATLLVWLPLWTPQVPANLLESLSLYVQLFEFNAGPYYALKGLFYAATGQDWSKWLGPALQVIFLLLLPLIYRYAQQRQWTFATASYVTLGAFFLLSTTVHPWYLLGILVFAAARGRPAWHWQWAGAASIATYLFYTGVPFVPLVIIIWGGWLMVLVGTSRNNVFLQRIMKRRGRKKAAWIAQQLGNSQRSAAAAALDTSAASAASDLRQSDQALCILDVGAGEGYVGEALSQRLGADVELIDVADFRPARMSLPLRIFDGRILPYDDDSFDVIVLSFVLHHTEDPALILSECHRVSRGQVIVLESVYGGPLHRRFLRWADRLTNRIRSSGLMRAQEENLHFRSESEWRALFDSLGYSVTSAAHEGRLVHRQILFVLDQSKRIGTAA